MITQAIRVEKRETDKEREEKGEGEGERDTPLPSFFHYSAIPLLLLPALAILPYPFTTDPL